LVDETGYISMQQVYRNLKDHIHQLKPTEIIPPTQKSLEFNKFPITRGKLTTIYTMHNDRPKPLTTLIVTFKRLYFLSQEIKKIFFRILKRIS
jgi:hypothetical protein